MSIDRYFTIAALVFVVGLFSGCNCSEEKPENAKTEQELKREANKTPDAHILDDGFVSAMNQLKGIEKHFVHGDLKRYRSLLKYQGNEKYKKVDDFLPALDEAMTFVEIKELDTKNGFMKYEALEIDCVYEMTYWKKEDGKHLIAETEVGCTMFCEGRISFQLYDPKADVYSKLKTSDVIVDVDILETDLLEKKKNGGIDNEYILPQKGLNIQHCIGDACVELFWNNGIFELKD